VGYLPRIKSEQGLYPYPEPRFLVQYYCNIESSERVNSDDHRRIKIQNR
jgi:hypothetical protein